MEMPKPTEAHKILERFVGTWQGEEKMYPSPWHPSGGVAQAKIKNRLSVDGFVVVQDYEQARDGKVNFWGHGVFSWDSAQNSYLLHWWDSMGMPVNVFKGQFEKDTLTMTQEGPQGRSRGTFKLIGDDRYTFKMDVSGDGEQWQTFMEGDYARKP
ncbi:MAG: DUF1579 family protein [bacterium]